MTIFTEEEILSAKKLYEGGATLAELGDIYYCSPETIGSMLRRNGTALRAPGARRVPAQTLTELEKLLDEGKSVAQIAKMMKYTQSNVYHLIGKLGGKHKKKQVPKIPLSDKKKMEEYLMQGYTTREIGDFMGKSAGSIRNLFYRTYGTSHADVILQIIAEEGSRFE